MYVIRKHKHIEIWDGQIFGVSVSGIYDAQVININT